VGRKTKYTNKFPGRVEIMARGGMIEVDMAAELGVSVKTFEDYKKRYPLFLQSLKKGKETVDDIVVAKLLTRALGYEYDEIVKERILANGKKSNVMAITKVTTKHVHPDVTAMIFWLKNRRPEEWREQKHVDPEQQVTPELKQTINILAILNQRHPDAFDKFVEVTTVPGANGTVKKRKQIQKKTKTRKKK